ncbi:isoaspartyl peptidase/L-asparaginase family protein [Bizionia arctica]|uniref:Isoaspartyl peptidase n=1 Tax=Bizionia arctica TaxID=1495645 RepID=A0A917GCS7_9FLAO|nr:isoaspartyl peptidase/L-asparaginase [Bizionia arctica]GGG37471.1 isoaspartyl peptidase/L-asparaginase [Bizionia arctica]
MKKGLYFLCLCLVVFGCKNEEELKALSNSRLATNDTLVDVQDIKINQFSIVIHGGAGNILRENMSAEDETAYKLKLEEAIRVGYNILKNGGTSLDAVEQTINVMEDSPLFNAGKGAVFTNAGTNELDASIMDGKTLNAGASAGTRTVKNPISLARAVMENSPHVMLAGNGADVFAKEQGLEIVDTTYFYTEKGLKSLKRVKEYEKKSSSAKATDESKEADNKTAFYDATIKNSKFGTVGCVALDKYGNLAAGTSTGGMTNKRWGRVGDVPIIGAGTYANNNTCAVSSTGWGEFFIRAMVAHDISALMDYKGLSLEEAAKEVIQKKVPELGGDGGIIAVDKNGNMVMEFNTTGMFRATMNDKGELYIGIFNDQEN